jgi:hypothetical protein
MWILAATSLWQPPAVKPMVAIIIMIIIIVMITAMATPATVALVIDMVAMAIITIIIITLLMVLSKERPPTFMVLSMTSDYPTATMTFSPRQQKKLPSMFPAPSRVLVTFIWPWLT